MADAKSPSIVELLSIASYKVGAVAKKERNTTGSGFNFRGVDTVVNAVWPEFREAGIIVTPTVVDRVYEQLEVGKNRSLMGHVLLRIIFTFYGPAGDSITATVDAESMDSGDKAVAKAMSVGFRTALLQVLALPTDDQDPDAESFERAPKQQAERPVAETPKPDPRIKAVWGKAKALGWDTDTLCNWLIEKSNGKVTHPDQLGGPAFKGKTLPNVLDSLQKLIDEAEKPAAEPEQLGDEEIPF